MTRELYQVRVKGHLDLLSWSNWLRGLTVAHLDNGETLLSGYLDQAALHGVLHKLENQGVPLIAVSRIVSNDLPPS
ncbi:hypothetical protein KDA_54050 [Dictyobacter alpinus]|uniref:Uncharacterized protein n=1 Tax=Dictyobacter alpinus TaxID=2014873 RepID=A0A402BER2_9CHLR|nr:hypothetical protein [Dictyobacter alpinus]GCE29921.1 hypothetical protein KDA_54050 [Dictyobacter alpinus]